MICYGKYFQVFRSRNVHGLVETTFSIGMSGVNVQINVSNVGEAYSSFDEIFRFYP